MHSPSSSPPPPPKPPSRRLPPPCWSDAETVALIDCYREKWYSLRRGNLRAPDWQEVADGVAQRCRLTFPAKTSIQCRHKMEKLRKRYRSEIQRIGSGLKRNMYSSSWIHFKLMHDMELGFSSSSDLTVSVNNRYDDVADEVPDEVEVEEDEDDMLLYHNGNSNSNGDGNRVRIKIPNFAVMTSARNNRLLDDLPPNMNPGYGSGGSGRLKRKSDGDNVMNEMVEAVRRLGDGFVRMERMKMDMARELESMRMKAEMRQTEMIIETHQKLWESFSKTVLEGKKGKRNEEGV
ncbi:putative transcription factor Trihelix family [Helianthus annuus]|nr:putative transcription factor Trihelix family [Helianthus annuus]